MDNLIKRIRYLLIKKRKTLAVAESCTGGLLSGLLTQIAGSSQYFILGIVAYSNKAKEVVLKIPRALIAKKGAVCAQTCLRMAQSVRKLAKTDFGIGITGIAGPTGGSLKKPVGTIFIAIDSANKKICEKFKFKGNRMSIRKEASLKALELLYAHIHRY